MAIFETRFARPGAIFTLGSAMGGLVALKVAEDSRLRDRVHGVLAFCPVVAGVQAWDTAFDIRLAYDAVCADAGNPLPNGDAPYPWALNLGDIPPNPGSFEPASQRLMQSLPSVAQCTGLGTPASARSIDQQGRLATLLQVTGIEDEKFLETQLGYATLGLGDLVRAADKLAGRNPFLNVNIEGERLGYGNAEIDARVRRVLHDPFARMEFERSSALAGTATARILAYTTSRDQLTPPQHLEVLREVYPNATTAQLIEGSYSHCGFNAAETHAAWEMLVPPLNDFTGINMRCSQEVATGTAGPCRNFAGTTGTGLRLRTRHALLAPRATSSGMWFDPARDGEGILIEELGHAVTGAIGYPVWRLPASKREVLVSWYTYAPPGDPNPGPRWLIGLGQRTDSGVFVPAMTITRGTRFGAAFDAADVVRENWGSLNLVVDPEQKLRLRYDGPEAWQGGERTMVRLLPTGLTQFGFAPANVAPAEAAAKISPPPPNVGPVSASGSYFNAARDGEGIQLIVGEQRQNAHPAVLVFYTYDPDGQQERYREC